MGVELLHAMFELQLAETYFFHCCIPGTTLDLLAVIEEIFVREFVQVDLDLGLPFSQWVGL